MLSVPLSECKKAPYNHRVMKRFFKLATFSILLCVNAIAADQAGKIVSVTGKVLMRSGESAQSDVRPVKPGDLILSGSVINTSSNSSCKILLSDKTILDLGPSSLFKIDDYKANGGADREAKMSLDYGKVRSSVTQPIAGKGSFNIRTKTATMGVRGTEFIINSELSSQQQEVATKTEVVVTKGTVEVGGGAASPSQAPVALNAGMQLKTDLGAIPTVQKMDAQALMTAKSEAKLPDPTFVQTVKLDSSNENNQTTAPNTTLASITKQMGEGKAEFKEAAPIGLPGLFGPEMGLQQLPRPPEGSTVNVTITFTP